MQRALDDHCKKIEKTTACKKKPYHRPRILSREHLEAGANVCPKADLIQCAGFGGSTQS